MSRYLIENVETICFETGNFLSKKKGHVGKGGEKKQNNNDKIWSSSSTGPGD